eukprot:123744_1
MPSKMYSCRDKNSNTNENDILAAEFPTFRNYLYVTYNTYNGRKHDLIFNENVIIVLHNKKHKKNEFSETVLFAPNVRQRVCLSHL